MPVSFTMYGRSLSPNVVVDGDVATDNAGSDGVDVVQDTLKADRMVVSVLHTTIGITITRRVLAFSQQNHDNYVVSEYVFKNTGIVDKKGTLDPKTLTDVYFFWEHRYGFGEEGYRRTPPTPRNDIGWGRNTVHHVVGTDPAAPGFEFRAHYAWYGRHSASPGDDIGLPAYWGDGHLTAAQYVGGVTLHADKSATDKSDDVQQPRSTPYVGSDDDAASPQANNQYNLQLMQRKYDVMRAGHPAQTQADQVGNGPADTWGTNPGGVMQAEGYGPYTLAPGDSIRIVTAEGVAGLSREMCYEVGRRWMANQGPFTLPNGTTTSDRDAYKNAWVQTGVDSLKQTFRRALANFRSGYTAPRPPAPPGTFDVASGGDRVRLTWSGDAESSPGFNGYEVHRAIARPDTFFTRIFSCDRATLARTFDDTSAHRGFDYYYYVVTKDDGTRNDVHAGIPLLSSRFATMTSAAHPAHLQRQAQTELSAIRVVPNPYDARAREIQFGTQTPDRIAFFGLPGVCTIKIYTERGDLVKTLEHNNGSGDELWDSTTTYRQVIVSGVYIAVITTPDGTSVIRKFIVIR
jgi:hypothetical protein